MSKPIANGWSSRPVTPGEFGIEELVYEEIVDEAGIPVAFIVDTADADGNDYANRVRSLVIDAPRMLDLLQCAYPAALGGTPIDGTLVEEMRMLLKKHGRA